MVILVRRTREKVGCEGVLAMKSIAQMMGRRRLQMQVGRLRLVTCAYHNCRSNRYVHWSQLRVQRLV